MLSILLDQIFKGSKAKDKIVRYAFFSLQGLLAGIMMNDILRIIYGDFDGKQDLEYGVSGFIAAVPFVVPQLTILDHKSNNVSLGAGMAFGTWMANKTEKKEKILPT